MLLKLMIVILILLLFLNIRIFTKQWCNPAYVMVLYWGFNIILALSIFTDYQWQFTGLLWIIIVCAFFSVSVALSGISTPRKIRHKTSNIVINDINQRSSKILWLCLIVGLIRVGLEITLNGFSALMFFSLDTLTEMNTTMAYARYHGEGLSYGAIMQVMLGIMYGGTLIAGYFFVNAFKTSDRIICVAAIVPIFFNMLFSNTKAVFIAGIILWVSGYITGFLAKNKRSPVIGIKNLWKMLMLALIFFSSLYMSMMLRMGVVDIQAMALVNKKFASYAIGHVPAFDYWFENGTSNIDYSYGIYTFYGMFQALGLYKREQGVYSDYLSTSEFTTNIYTMFRGVISDFGIYGGMIFFIAFGLIAGYVYKCVLHKDHSVLASLILASTYFFIGFSFVVSAWTYASYIVAFLVFGAYLWFIKQKIKI